jgi:hypothetical protein
MSFAYSFVKAQLEERRAQYLKSNTKLTNIPTFSPGDRVWLLIPLKTGKQMTGKFTTPYEGPYEVIERVGAVNYKITPVEKKRRGASMIVHALRLKPYYESELETKEEPLNRARPSDVAFRRAPGLRAPNPSSVVADQPSVVPAQLSEAEAASSISAPNIDSLEPAIDVIDPPIISPARHTRSRARGQARTYTGQQ